MNKTAFALAAVALVASGCVFAVEVTPHGADVYSVRLVTLQAAPDVTPTPEVLPRPTSAPPEPCIGTVTATVRLNVRSGPGTQYGVVAQINPGAQVEVIGAESGWYEIAAPSGWVSGLYVALSEGDACAPFGL